MPKHHRSRKETDQIALQFYNDKLLHNPTLRQNCEDRHVLDETITAWKDEQYRLTGVPIKGMSRSQFIFSLRSRWKLIDVKVAEENVIVWSDRADYLQSSSSSSAAVVVPAHVNVHVDSKADKIAKTIERIRNSRQEMESNRDGIVIDPITFDGNDDVQSGGGGVLRIGELASQTVRIRNTSYMDVHCNLKDNVSSLR